MSFGWIHGLMTVLLMILFAGIIWWAFSRRNKERFEEAANLPFADDDNHPAPKRSHEGDKK
ncbi:cytochrome C oxidase [Thioalkalivibrio paradoxus ARh 1]|uniref:Cytochrome C oxidase n=2 Tax=Thioalkalivibrio paradoxus TaxID=108010 RepID=W0DH44_9GAMM|nr:cbb3-type cytochrome c oxidase subunit 3 [Thioalkalivibrio paradoxus]AHE97954.1 cytochrome C oxidase [Thioalkalivibrio paradoxus ARh 1]